MIGWPARRLGINAVETEPAEIQLIDKNVDHSNRVLLANPVLQAIGKQRRLAAIQPFYKTPHPILR